MAILNSICNVVWGAPMLTLFLFTALRFSFKSRFFQIRKFPYIIKNTIGSSLNLRNGGISEFSAFCSVLGACIGTGNIVGVATALYSGGPGVVFWMWISAIFSMMTSYAENYLGASYHIKDSLGRLCSGAFAYIEKGVKMKYLAKIYALFSIASAIGMGNLTQSNSFSDSLKNTFGISTYVSGGICAILCFMVIWGGIKRIAKFQTVCVPVMSFIYLTLSLTILLKFKENIVPSIILILREAFSLRSLKGYGIYKAMQYGISRGVFSNESGLGSSTLLHAEANIPDGKKQGMWAIAEVFTDTVFMCTLTALVILVSTKSSYTTLFGAELSTAAYSSLGNWGAKAIGVLTSVFAFTSLTGCSFYGEKSLQYLTHKKTSKIYKIVYAIIVFIGCTNPPKIIWTIADICNGLMALPNLFAINVLGSKVEY